MMGNRPTVPGAVMGLGAAVGLVALALGSCGCIGPQVMREPPKTLEDYCAESGGAHAAEPICVMLLEPERK